jgi:signal transduction histidine kinase
VVKSSKKYQGGADAPERLVLHFVPFTQGMMYVGSPDFLDETQIELVEALANAFAVAYARYEDFIQLEAAKGRVEDTLDDLKAAQNQLIHAEKMASLGELTAGIAHEIQNPLNFVNNFSDVNSELIEEMLEEIKAGNFEEAVEIAQDIEGNEQKIKHHGKRAEAIVKSMLQHSRSSSTQKELTDINDLADEYLRLAYHGMRAKDKSFNASMKTDFDKTLDKIEVVPQEIGRVLLNLITNAFHAVNERKMNGENGYAPEVLVATKRSKDRIQISVKDNGGGIPRRILDKIFQPFFTTKPTGQGTGLGLSLSYDIVRVHNGELKVETQEGQGTEFIVELPMV